MTKVYAASLLFIISMIIGVFIKEQPLLLHPQASLYFGEFVQSTNFEPLLQDSLHSFTYRLGGGTYNGGFPVSDQRETVFGTQRGSRTFPLLLFIGTLHQLLGTWWDRVYLILVLSAPLIGFLFATTYFKPSHNKLGIFIGACVFAFNPWIFSRLQTGFWQLHLAYATIPFVFLYFASHANTSLKKRLDIIGITGTILSLSIMYAFQPHFILMLSFPITIMLLYGLVSSPRSFLRDSFPSLIVVTIGFLLTTAYHTVPSLLHTFFYITLPGQDLSLAAVNFNGQGSRLIDVLKLTSVSPLAFSTYTFTQLDYARYGLVVIVSIYAFASLLIRKTRINSLRPIALYMLMCFLFMFLAKGINGPMIETSRFLYSLAFFGPFRDPSRFYSMIAFSISMIFVYAKISPVFLRRVLAGIFFVWFIPTTFSLATETGKQLHMQKIPHERYATFENNHYPERLLFLPQNMPLSYYEWHQGKGSGTYNNPADTLIPLKSTQASYTGFMDTYFNQLNWYASQRLAASKPFEHLWSRMLVKEVLIDTGLKNEVSEKAGTIKILESLSHNDSFVLSKSKTGIHSFMLSSGDQLITDAQPIFVIGDLQTFDKAVDISGDAPVILLNQPVNSREFQSKNIRNQTILFDDRKEVESLFLETLSEYSVHLESEAWDNETDWSLHEAGLHADVAKGFLYTSGRSIEPKSLDGTLLVHRTLLPGKYIVVARTNIPDPEGKLVFTIEGKIFTLPFKEDVGFHWETFGTHEFSGTTDIMVTAKGSRSSIIDDVLIIPERVFKRAREKYREQLDLNTLVPLDSYEKSLSKQSSHLNILQNDFSIWEINSPSRWVTMRMQYENGWQISNQKAKFVGDYYGMTFLTTPSRMKRITYAPEKTFTMAMYVSILSVIVVIGIFSYAGLRTLKVMK